MTASQVSRIQAPDDLTWAAMAATVGWQLGGHRPGHPAKTFSAAPIDSDVPLRARNVLLVEDHPLVQGAIRAVIRSISADIAVDVAGSLAEAFCLMNERAPDLAIVDLILPDSCGTGTIQAFRRRAVGVPILATSAHIDAATATVLRMAGVTAIVAKTCTFDEWRATIRSVLAGDPRRGGATLRFGAVTGSPSGANAIRAPTAPAQADGRLLSFTPRQRQVLKLLLLGMGNKEICRTTGMAPGTVKVHVSALLRTLRVSTRAQVVIAAQQAGIRIEDLC